MMSFGQVVIRIGVGWRLNSQSVPASPDQAVFKGPGYMWPVVSDARDEDLESFNPCFGISLGSCHCA